MSNLLRPAPNETSEPADELAALHMLLDHAEAAIELVDAVDMPTLHDKLLNLLSQLHFEIEKYTQRKH